MVHLLIQCDEKQLGEYLLEGEVTTIGRRKDNTLYLEDASVSRRHAQIKKEQSKYTIEDLQSSNGTFVNGKKVTSQTLQSEDKIEVGKYTLIFRDRPVLRREDETTIDKKGRPVSVSEPVVSLRLVIIKGANTNRQFPLDKQEVEIGRAEGNDIVLLNDTISREHAKIVKKDGGIILVDSGSQNGTFVNGKRIKRQESEDGDEIAIGSITFKFMQEKRAKKAGKTVLKRRLKKPVLVAASALVVFILLLRFALPSRNQDSAFIKEGIALHNLGQWKEAVTQLEKAIKLNPQSKEAAEWLRKVKTELSLHTHLELGKEHFDSRNWIKSAWQMNEVLKIRPNHEKAKIYLHKIRRKVSLEDILKEAVRYCQAGEWTRAVEKLEDILSIDPEHLEAKRYLEKAKQELFYINLFDRGVGLFEMGEYSRCIKELSKIPEWHRHFRQAQDYLARARKRLQIKGYYSSGMDFYRSGDVKKAREEFYQALSLDPGNLEVQGSLARMEEVTEHMKRAERFHRKGKAIEASQEWQRLLSLESNSENYFHRLALSKLEELKPKLARLAEEHFAKGLLLEEKGNLKEASVEYSLALKAQSDHAKAGKHLEVIKAELTKKARHFYERGIIFEQWGDRERAKENFQKVLDLVPSDHRYYIEAKRRLQRYE